VNDEIVLDLGNILWLNISVCRPHSVFAAPGPASGAVVIAQADRHSARRTADAAVSFGQQRMGRQVVFLM